MYRNLALLVSIAILSYPALGQEPDEEASDDVTTEAVDPEPEPDDEEPEFDETGLDEQGFSNEDDDFNPSEDIPADQSIEFPADI